MSLAADAPLLLPDDRVTRGQTLLFAAAGAAVAAAHAGAILLALQRPPSPSASEEAAAAVMIELAPEPAAPQTTAPVFSPDAYDAPELPDLVPPEVAPPKPAPPTVSEAAPTPPHLDVPAPEAQVPPQPQVVLPAAPSEVAIARPRARPADLPPRAATDKEPEAEPPRPAPASKLARRAAVDAPPAPVAAASKTSTGGIGQVALKDWQSRLMAHLERRKRYPADARARREEGVAHVSFTIDGSGNVLSVRLARSSGFPDLDAAVVALIRRASPVPAPAAGAPRDITAPVRFRLR